MSFASLLARAVGAFALLAASSALAQTVITSVPYTITTSGKYVLGGNFITNSAAESAITINAPNVILDLNGFFVSGPGNSTTSLTPVIFVAGVTNVTIRNGTVANNYRGIFFNSGGRSINHLVENVNVTRCLQAGIFFNGPSAGSIVRNNAITQIGGNTSGSLAGYGVYVTTGVRIENNLVNRVAGSTSGGITASGYGIAMVTEGSFAVGNTITNCTYGIFGGKYANNLTFNCETPFSLGTGFGYND